jgi:hypothetical protein
MPYSEFVGWCYYFKARPPGYAEDMRTYYIMSSMTEIKKKPEEIFPTIRAVVNSEKARKPEFREGVMPENKMLDNMRKARGGDGEFNLEDLIQRGVKNNGVRSEHGSSGLRSRVEKSSLRG